MEQLEHIKYLYQKYLDKTISEVERQQLMRFFQTATDTEMDEVIGVLANAKQYDEADLEALNQRTARVFERVAQHTQPKTKKLWLPIAISTAALLALALVIYYYNAKDFAKATNQTVQVGENIPAGTNKATLQLANGKTILLDQAAMGQIAQQSGVKVTKTTNGQLVYEVLDNDQPTVAINTISTPKGGQYQVMLPDGSTVYLNAASKLSFPTRFIGAQRRVELAGEAYFEVAKNTKQPFIVSTATQQVQVLGTHFNINSYTDEGQTVTTLAEGAVRVSLVQGSKQAIDLTPGQQAIQQSNNLQQQTADLETALAWKNGKLKFKDEDLKTIMRQVARWYDIEVSYSGEIPNRRFVASVPRNANLATLLKVLQLSNINFKMEGKKLIVTP